MKTEPSFNFGTRALKGEFEMEGAGSKKLSGRVEKIPRTARGERTLRKILDAALIEFGERGYSEGSIVGITSRAKVALGTFYTYFNSKEDVF